MQNINQNHHSTLGLPLCARPVSDEEPKKKGKEKKEKGEKKNTKGEKREKKGKKEQRAKGRGTLRKKESRPNPFQIFLEDRLKGAGRWSLESKNHSFKNCRG
jgi:hypothetical protein